MHRDFARVHTAITYFDTVNDGPQTDFQFGQVTLVADADGVASAKIIGSIQTAADPTPIFDNFSFTLAIGDVPVVDVPGCNDPTATNFNPFATMDDGSCTFPTPPTPTPLPPAQSFESAVGILFFVADILFDGVSDVGLADDPVVFPNGATVFAPDRTVMEGILELPGLGGFDVDDLIFAPRLSEADLNDLVPDTGDLVTLTAMNGSTYELGNGLNELGSGLTFGGANVTFSRETENGWVHILDAVPSTVPEPGSLPLAMIAGLFGINAARRRRIPRSIG